MTKHETQADIGNRLAALKQGETCIYHVGNLAFDRGWDAAGRKRDKDEARIHDTANLAWRLHQAGRVALTQRRVDNGICAYIATGIGR